MPTAAKMIAAILLALLAMIVSEQFKPQMPPNFAFGNFTFVNAGFAVIVGWAVIGARSGRGRAQAINNGISGVLALLVLLLFYHSGRMMLINSINLRYGSFVEGVTDVFQMMADYALLLATAEIISTLVVGALIVGLSAEAVSRRWR